MKETRKTCDPLKSQDRKFCLVFFARICSKKDDCKSNIHYNKKYFVIYKLFYIAKFKNSPPNFYTV